MLGLGRGLLGDIGTGDVCQPGAVRLFHPGHVEREAEFPPAAQADPTGPAQGQAALPGPNSCGQQFLPLARRQAAARVFRQTAGQSCGREAQQPGENLIGPQQLHATVRSAAQQAETYRHPVQQRLRIPQSRLPPGKGRLQVLPLPPEAVDIQKDAAEDRGPLAGRQDFRPEIHPDCPTVPPQQAEVVIHAPFLPRRVQQFLEQRRPVRRSHQSGKGPAAPVQQRPPGPLGQLAQLPAAGKAPQSLPVQLQIRAGQELRQRAALGSGPRPGIQQAGHRAVHHLIAGNGEGLAPGGHIGEGGGGAGKSYGLHGRQLLQRPLWPELGQAAALHLLRGEPQKRRRGRIQKAAHQIHHLPAAVGQYLRQGEGDGAVPEGLGKLVQMLCHRMRLLPDFAAFIINGGPPHDNGARRNFFVRQSKIPCGPAAARFRVERKSASRFRKNARQTRTLSSAVQRRGRGGVDAAVDAADVRQVAEDIVAGDDPALLGNGEVGAAADGSSGIHERDLWRYSRSAGSGDRRRMPLRPPGRASGMHANRS